MAESGGKVYKCSQDHKQPRGVTTQSTPRSYETLESIHSVLELLEGIVQALKHHSLHTCTKNNTELKLSHEIS